VRSDRMDDVRERATGHGWGMEFVAVNAAYTEYGWQLIAAVLAGIALVALFGRR